MPGGCEHELEYLRRLSAQFGAHYFKEFFGFTLNEIAEKLGMSKSNLSRIISGKNPMAEKHHARFAQIFKEMDIENRTKDFKPTNEQAWRREWYQKIRLDKMVIIYILITMSLNTLFLKPALCNFREYIRRNLANLASNIHSTIYKAITKTVVAFFIFLTFNTQF